MPKDDIDPEDPLELCGVGLVTDADTTEAMAECFIEEFMRLGRDAAQILALFRNPHYTGVNMVLENRGEEFVRAKIREVFGWWQRDVTWSGAVPALLPRDPVSDGLPRQETKFDPGTTDPNGAVMPKLNT